MRRSFWFGWLVALTMVVPAASLAAQPGAAANTLTVYAAGTLAIPFQQLDKVFMKRHPGVVVRPQFGGSVMMARRISDLHQHVDVYASADYTVIPEILGAAGLASWFVGFASNAVTLAYTSHSRGAAQINAENWYRVVAQPGVVIGRSDPNTDPSGYRFLQMLSLASGYYHDPGLEKKILRNAPRRAMRNTETSLISALQLGQIDYLAIYTSSAKLYDFNYVHLPPDIDLSDASKTRVYAHGRAKTDAGVRHGKPIVYALTIPRSADNRKLAIEYVQLLLSERGRKIFSDAGFISLAHPLVHGESSLPAVLRPDTQAWPAHLVVGK